MSDAAAIASETVIHLENVAVRYRAHQGRRRSFKNMVVNFGKNSLPSALHEGLLPQSTGSQPIKDFWALRDVRLSVAAGEVLGVIGRNGAGKSTLLSVLSRVLKPTVGTVTICGKIAPLLSLGAGFDQELTGSENIYLLGALLGFSKRYVDEHYDEIVAFSELRDFIDAPVRTYSSGMLARLGFAIATSAEADILLVDEVLAVGDERFRKKCEDRIRLFRANHMTIVLVSHSMASVVEMCTRAVWLDKGCIVADGDAAAVVDRYQTFMAGGKNGAS